MTIKRIPGFCALCKSKCGSIMVTENGRLIAQEPNPDHPTGVALCVKGRAAPEIVYRPERQLYPLMRTRPKGDSDPGWKRISWDDALDRIARELDRIRAESGPEAVAFSWTTPSGTPIGDDIRWIERFTNAFGSPNVAYGVEVCNWHKDYAHAYTFGRSIASPDFEKAGCIVLWGHNPSATWLDHATATAAASARGAKIIVIDPRKVGFASRADQWVRVRPGSDGALALGIAREMIRNGWFDEPFVTRWTNGPLLVRTDTMRFVRASELRLPVSGGESKGALVAMRRDGGGLMAYSPANKAYLSEALPELTVDIDLPLASGGRVRCRSAFSLYRELCEPYTPECVEVLCWMPKDQVTAVARLLNEARPICYYMWTGTGQHTNATQTDRAIAIVMALTGSFDAPGGNVDFTRPPSNDVTGGELLTTEQRAKCVELTRSPLGPGRHAWITAETLYRAILEEEPYRVRGMMGFGRNFLVSHGNVGRGIEAFTKLEFYVHLDVVMSPTASYSDIFLPINTPWERDSLRVGFEGSQAAENLIQLRQAAIESRGESRSDGFVVFELAQRLGMGHLFWDGDIEAGLNHVLKPTGLTVGDLRKRPQGVSLQGETRYRKYLQDGFKTPTGRIEIFSEMFRDAGQDPLPQFVEPAKSPMRSKSDEFPLVLTSAKVVQFCHSQHRDIPSLRKKSPEPEVQLHPDTAGERGIEDGMTVEVRTHLGVVRMKARLEPTLDPRVVWAQYGWWAGNEALGMPAGKPFSDDGANLNRLISDEVTDPISGSVPHRSYLCDVAPVLAEGDRGWPGWRAFNVASTTVEADEVMSFVLKPVDGKPLPSYLGGQHVNVRAKAPDGTPLVRCYSLCGDFDEGAYRISIKLSRDERGIGRMSGLMHSLSNGSRVELQAPKGKFHLPPGPWASNERPVVLVAGGIGITPFMSMLYQLQGRADAGPVRLVYGVRSARDHAFRAEIRELRDRLPSLSVTTFYGRAEESDRASSAFDREGNLAVDALLEGHGEEAEFYVCGPPRMVELVTDALHGAGVPKERVHLEAFGPSSRKSTQAHNGPQPVTLVKSNKTIIWSPDAGTLLDQLEATGARLGSGCRTGQCESCVLGLIEGQVVHPEGTATVESGRCLPCVALPLSPVQLDA